MAIKLSGLDCEVKGSTVFIPIADSHPLVRLSKVLPWQDLGQLVANDLKTTTAKGFWWLGRILAVRVHLAIYILQKIYDKTDRQIASDVVENAAYRLFSGSEIVSDWHAPHFSKIEEFRNRLSPTTQMEIANRIAKVAVDLGFADPRKVDLDSTVQEANATYPSDARLMVQLSERAVKVVQWLKTKVPQLFPKEPIIDLKEIKGKAKAYFFASKNMIQEKKREIFAALQSTTKKHFLRAEAFVQGILQKQDINMPWNIRKSYDQVFGHGRRYLLDVAHFIRNHTMKAGKRLSWHLDAIACIVKGKTGKAYEFGRVFQIGRIGGNFVFTYPHESLRMDDKQAVSPLLKQHEKTFGTMELESFATDKGYYSLANETAALSHLNRDENVHLGYQYEDVAEVVNSQLRDHRAGLEAIIGHIKHGGQLGRSRMKSDQATLAAAYAAMAGFNLRQLIRAQGTKTSTA